MLPPEWGHPVAVDGVTALLDVLRLWNGARSEGEFVAGAGLEKVMVVLKSSPAKKADWEGEMVTTSPSCVVVCDMWS